MLTSKENIDTETLHLAGIIPEDYRGMRLDQALVLLFPEHSRSRLKDWIDEGKVWVDNKVRKPKDKILGGEHIQISAEMPLLVDSDPEEIPLDIVYEDEHILVINKPAGLVVHPAVGNRSGTLLNALMHRTPELVHIPRAGIVHRLDKDTSGLMVVAKTLEAHTDLVLQLQARTVNRTYETVVWGMLPSGGTVEAKIGRHPRDRKKMGVVEKGKLAISHYRVIEKFRSHTHLRVHLETGRTHQIRVHMAHIYHPIVGDKLYGGRLRVPPKASDELLTLLRTFPRQALHAKQLGLVHPFTREECVWEVTTPTDILELIQMLRFDAQAMDAHS
jgi:23S rRNA pseudouridine1911/1915/1917 synthase